MQNFKNLTTHPKFSYLYLGLIPLIIFTAFLPCLNAQFLNWDDDRHLTENLQTQIHSFENTLKIFKSTVNETYIPLSILSFNIEHRFWGLNPFVYHLNNLLLHLAVIAGIFILAHTLGLSYRGAFFSSLIFGLHPMHVESVAWITERKDVLYSLFYILACQQYWQYLLKKKKSFYVKSLFFALLSILAKPMALSLPWILFLWDWLFNRKPEWQMLIDKIPFFLIIEPIAWITYSLNARNPEFTFPDSLLVWVWTFSFYIEKFFFPVGLFPLYELPQPVSFSNVVYLKALLFFLIFWGIFLYCLVRKLLFQKSSASSTVQSTKIFCSKNWIIFACLFYGGSTFFLWRYDTADASIVADRFMYLPSLGFCLLFGFISDEFLKKFSGNPMRKKILITGLCVLFSGLAIKTFLQCQIWKTPLTFWNAIIKNSPNNHLAYNNRGNLYSQKEYLLAIEDFDRAIALSSDYAEAYYNKGLTLARMGRYDEALLYYDRTLILDPEFVEAYNNRGFIYGEIKKDYDRAAEEYSRAIAVHPEFPEAYHNRGLIFARQGDWDLALEDFNKAIDLHPNYLDAYVNRGNLWALQGEYHRALEDFSKAKTLGASVSDAQIEQIKQLINNIAL